MHFCTFGTIRKKSLLEGQQLLIKTFMFKMFANMQKILKYIKLKYKLYRVLLKEDSIMCKVLIIAGLCFICPDVCSNYSGCRRSNVFTVSVYSGAHDKRHRSQLKRKAWFPFIIAQLSKYFVFLLPLFAPKKNRKFKIHFPSC